MPEFENAFFQESEFAEAMDWIESIGYASACFILPFLLSHSSQQLLLGTIVNTAIILAAVRLNWKKTLPVIFFPSLGVLAAGALFGSLTPFLFYLIPFIWTGNTLLAFAFKRFKSKNYALKAFLGAGLKAFFLGLFTFLLFSLSLLPQALLIPMSAVQFFTALSGSIIAFFSLKALDLF